MHVLAVWLLPLIWVLITVELMLRLPCPVLFSGLRVMRPTCGDQPAHGWPYCGTVGGESSQSSGHLACVIWQDPS